MFKGNVQEDTNVAVQLLKMSCKLDRGSFVVLARSSALNPNKHKAILLFCALFFSNIPCCFHLNTAYMCSIWLKTLRYRCVLGSFLSLQLFAFCFSGVVL